jgi:MtN3 and saliva related transmembrane protein
MTVGEFFGYIALVTSIIGLSPQVYKSFRTKSMSDVSMLMLINYLVCSVAWIIHGIYIGSDFVIWSNIIGTILSVVSIIQKVFYDGYKSRKL